MFTDTEFKNTNRAAGSEFYTPDHMVQLWTKYTFDDSTPALDGFFIGGGVKIFSSLKNISRTAAGAQRRSKRRAMPSSIYSRI